MGAEPQVARPLWRRALGSVPAIVVVSSVVGFGVWFATLPELDPVERFVDSVPDGQSIVNTGWRVLSISPDGRHYVYNESQGIALRTLDQIDARTVSGTGENRGDLFLSPDGQSVGYFTNANEGMQLNRIAITGGASVRLAVVPDIASNSLLGASWAADDMIFIGTTRGIYRVSATGGEPELIIPSENDQEFSSPRLLPDGDSLLFGVTVGDDFDAGQIVVESLTRGERSVLVNGGSDARYLPTGHLVFAFEDGLFAIAFDAEDLTVSGGRVPLVQGVSRSPTSPTAHYSISENGTLIYLSGTVTGEGSTLVWTDRDGNPETIEMPSRLYRYAALSPDGTQIVTDIRDQENDTFTWNLERGTLQRLTFDPGLNRGAVWSPDGTRVAFSRELDGSEEIFWQSADGSGVPEPLTEGSPAPVNPSAFSADGTVLFYHQVDYPRDIWTVPVEGPPSEAAPLLAGPANEWNASLSPDGRWLAYESDESGQIEVYVRPYPAVDTGRWQISTDGGTRPQWRGDGGELFYLVPGAPDTIMVVPIEADETFLPGAPEELFQHDIRTADGSATWSQIYDVTPDGQRFLLVSVSGDTSQSSQFIIVQNWLAELERLVPTN